MKVTVFKSLESFKLCWGKEVIKAKVLRTNIKGNFDNVNVFIICEKNTAIGD